MTEATEKYQRAVELANTVESRVGKLLPSALERLGNPDLVKAVLDKPRIKALASVAQKAAEKGWSIEEAIEKCWDFVGFRLVCSNTQDVYRAADLFQQALENHGMKTERHDYIAAVVGAFEPEEGSYRVIRLPISHANRTCSALGIPITAGRKEFMIVL